MAMISLFILPDLKRASAAQRRKLGEGGRPLLDTRTLIKVARNVRCHFDTSVCDLSIMHTLISARLSLN